MRKKLEIGKIYTVTHQRKGTFVALLEDILTAKEAGFEGDEQDEVFLAMVFDVRAGTDQEGLATVKGQVERRSQLRPSVIITIEEYDGDSWLRQVKRKPVPKTKEKQNLLATVRGLFK